MNKVLFIFNKGNAIGGVWNVNQLIANKLLDDNYEIIYLAIREYDKNIAPCCDKRIKYYTINPNTKNLLWKTNKVRLQGLVPKNEPLYLSVIRRLIRWIF